MRAAAHLEVVLVEDRGYSMVSEWHYRVVARMTVRRVFTVKTQQWGGTPPSRARWYTFGTAADLRSPTGVMEAIEGAADEVGVPDWGRIVELLRDLDWVTAAVIAVKKQVPVPRRPGGPCRHRLLRTGCGVEVGVEWGYDWHYLKLPFGTWLAILDGDYYKDTTPYHACGLRYTAEWHFSRDAEDQLVVTYDDGGVGWIGNFTDIPSVTGPSVDGVDLAQAALHASGSVAR